MKLLLFLSLLAKVCFSQPLSQLRVEGKPEINSSEIITKENKDSNGEVCAGFMIIHDMEGLTYDSYNKIVKINSKPGNDLLYLSPSEQVVTIYRSGYEPLKLILNELGIKLKSGEVWQIKLTGDKILDLIPISIVTTPKNAEVIIDNISKGTGTTFETNAGEHELRIELKSYRTLETKIYVSKKNILFNYQLEVSEPEIVTIRTEPKEAAVYMDGIIEGDTDVQIFRYPGKYKLRLTKSGYSDIDQEIEIKTGGQNNFTFTLIKNISFLNLTISPSDAEVEIDNKNIGKVRDIELAPGEHLLVIKKTGYREARQTITLALNQPVTKTIILEPITGSLQVKVIPIESNVQLLKDGKVIEKWKGAKILRDLIVGSYTLEAQLDGYEKFSKTFQISESTISSEEIKLNSGVVNKPFIPKNVDENFKSIDLNNEKILVGLGISASFPQNRNLYGESALFYFFIANSVSLNGKFTYLHGGNFYSARILGGISYFYSTILYGQIYVGYASSYISGFNFEYSEYDDFIAQVNIGFRLHISRVLKLDFITGCNFGQNYLSGVEGSLILGYAFNLF